MIGHSDPTLNILCYLATCMGFAPENIAIVAEIMIKKIYVCATLSHCLSIY